MSQSRDDGGQCHPDVTDRDILRVFDTADDPVLTTREVASGLERYGVQPAPEQVRPCLDQMVEKGLVNRIELGTRAVGWWPDAASKADVDGAGRVDGQSPSDERDDL